MRASLPANPADRGVAIMPGATALARMRSACQAARWRVYPITAALVAAYQSGDAPMQLPATDATFTRAASAGRSVLIQVLATSSMLPAPMTRPSANGTGTALAGPALLTRYRAGRPRPANPPATSSALVTSTRAHDAAPPAARMSSAMPSAVPASRSQAATASPAAAPSRAVARPMPLPAPVTTIRSPAVKPKSAGRFSGLIRSSWVVGGFSARRSGARRSGPGGEGGQQVPGAVAVADVVEDGHQVAGPGVGQLGDLLPHLVFGADQGDVRRPVDPLPAVGVPVGGQRQRELLGRVHVVAGLVRVVGDHQWQPDQHPRHRPAVPLGGFGQHRHHVPAQ